MHAFSPAAARATAQSAGTAGDDRVAAAERAAAMPFPTPAEEIWRYSRIGELDLERFRPGVATTTVEGGDGLVSVGAATDGSTVVVDGPAPDVFAELNVAFAAPVVVRVPPGTVVDGVIVVTHDVAGDGTAVFPRLVLDVGDDSEVTVVERFRSAAGDVVFVAPVVQVHAAPAA